MNREDYLKFHRDCCDRMVEITGRKNADYAGDSGDAFFNFTRVEVVGIADTERGFLTRMFDKFARIITFVNVGVLQVKDESVEDTLLDLANYCILMAGYIKSKREKAMKAVTSGGGGGTSCPTEWRVKPEWTPPPVRPFHELLPTYHRPNT